MTATVVLVDPELLIRMALTGALFRAALDLASQRYRRAGVRSDPARFAVIESGSTRAEERAHDPPGLAPAQRTAEGGLSARPPRGVARSVRNFPNRYPKVRRHVP